MRPARLVLALALLLTVPPLTAATLPRTPLPKQPLRLPPLDAAAGVVAPAFVLEVKFVDEARVRADAAGRLTTRSRAHVDDAAALNAFAAREGIRFAPALGIDEARLRAFARRAESLRGRAAPDLAALHHVLVPFAAPDRLVRLGEHLQSSPLVEFAHVALRSVPPPCDLPPRTPDYVPQQGHLLKDPGIGVEQLQALGVTGAGVRIADVEYGWVLGHEDLCAADLTLEPGQTPVPQVGAWGWDEHGTAVLGVTSAGANGFGCTGVAPGAAVRLFPEWTLEGGLRRLDAIASAMIASSIGDIVLLEMQTVGPDGLAAPAEIDPAVWLLCRAGTDAGLIVVAAAGNGGANLDGPAYASYAAYGHSGAILVGAGSNDTAHQALGFSTHGSRVDVQSWGLGVVTLGYGSLATFDASKQQTYAIWSGGTSAATALVAGACAVIQQAHRMRTGMPLLPEGMRALLVATGHPQAGGGHVGPAVDVGAAFAALPPSWHAVGEGTPGSHGTPLLVGSGADFAGKPFALVLRDARPVSPAFLVLGAAPAYLPFAGGTFVPAPHVVLGAFVTSPIGAITLVGTTPAVAAAGFDVYAQFWVIDPAAFTGLAGSNAVTTTLPHG